MAKILSETEVELRVEFTGYQSSFRMSHYAPEELERRKLRFRDDFERLVKRHVSPHADGEFYINDSTKRIYACSACGAEWSEKSDTFNGGCCDADMANDPEAVPAA